MTDQETTQAVQGLMRVEECILALAEQRHVRGFKIEWNDDMDLGHLMDPVPIALLTDAGRVSGQFRLRDLARFTGVRGSPLYEEIDRLVRELGAIAQGNPPLHEPPGAP
jgi:hypothetical protein